MPLEGQTFVHGAGGALGYESWSAELARAEAILVPGEVIKLQRKLVFLTLGAAVELGPGRYRRISGVVLLTPVDTGRARSSWNIDVGQPRLVYPPAGLGYRRSPPKLQEAQSSLRRLGAYETVWITSSLPYITVLEYGEYPDPVLLGTWDRKLRRWVIRSHQGFSKQAPHGMVRVTVQQLLLAIGA